MTPPAHCGHECVCMGYVNRAECYGDLPCNKTVCDHRIPTRSRPAPSSHEENNVIKNLKAICEAQQEKIVALLEIRALYEEKEKLQEQYDTAIATQAREDETNRIISILEGYRLGLDYPDCPPGDTIKSLVESIRSSTEAQQ